MDLKTKLDGYIEAMNAQSCAVDTISALQNYAGAFMLAYERGELVVKDKDSDDGVTKCQ